MLEVGDLGNASGMSELGIPCEGAIGDRSLGSNRASEVGWLRGDQGRQWVWDWDVMAIVGVSGFHWLVARLYTSARESTRAAGRCLS